MKRFAIFLMLCVLALSVSANNIRYFTLPQANRVVTALTNQPELMIYCGYQNELATYVILSDVWYEPINSKYYELWIFGYDAYTGEEIYMPIDLSCIWLFNGRTMYSAADYMRFRNSRTAPSFAWSMPRYNTFVRVVHAPGYHRTYHYAVHQYGWMPPAVPPPGSPARMMHPYYLRQPGHPAPHPDRPYTPGIDRPNYTGKYNGFSGHEYIGSGSADTKPTGRISTPNADPSRNSAVSGRNGNNNKPATGNNNTRNGNNNGGTYNGGNSSRGNNNGGNTNVGNSSRGNNNGGTYNGGNSNRGNNNGGGNTNVGNSSRGNNNNSGNTNGGNSSRGNNGNKNTTTGTTSRSNTATQATTTTSRQTTTTSRVSGTTVNRSASTATSRSSATTTNTSNSSRGTVNSGSNSSRGTSTSTSTSTTTTNARSTVNSGTSSSRSTSSSNNGGARQGRR